MLPSAILVDEECIQDDTEVENCEDDPVIRVNFTKQDGDVLYNQHFFFQDGSALLDGSTNAQQCSEELEIVGAYSGSENIVLGMVSYGEGVVAVSEPHIEADASFWADDNFTKPDNTADVTNGYLVGLDSLEQVFNATPASIQQNAKDGCASEGGDLESTPPVEETPSLPSGTSKPDAVPATLFAPITDRLDKILKLLKNLVYRRHREHFEFEPWESEE